MYIETPVYNPKKGYDVYERTFVKYDGNQFATAEQAAKGLYEALKKLAVAMDQGESEVMLQTPEQAEAAGVGSYWRVCWEAGPYDWAIGASFQIRGAWGYTEPYYGFDLCFVSFEEDE